MSKSKKTTTKTEKELVVVPNLGKKNKNGATNDASPNRTIEFVNQAISLGKEKVANAAIARYEKKKKERLDSINKEGFDAFGLRKGSIPSMFHACLSTSPITMKELQLKTSERFEDEAERILANTAYDALNLSHDLGLIGKQGKGLYFLFDDVAAKKTTKKK